MRFTGKTAIVTGAANGIGRGCAERLLADGARVAALDVDIDAGRAMVEELSSRGEIVFEECDVGRKPAVDRAVGAVIERFGAVDILVNNAGITKAGDLLDLTEDDFDLVIRTNLKSVFLMSQAAGRHMIQRGKGGAIVNMSSTSVIMTMPNIAPYAASKGGISSLTRAMALHFAPHGIRVNAVGPGTIVTKLTQSRVLKDPELVRRILSRTPLGRFGQPSDVASVVSFLASEDAGYVTGQTLYVDGGRSGLNYTVPVAE